MKSFPLIDAKLAVDIAAIRDQIALLSDRVRFDSRDKPRAVRAHLADAQQALNEALADALCTMEK